MVSIKALTLLALTASAVTAFPQYGHARFHLKRNAVGAELAPPTGFESHHHEHDHNETEPGPVVDCSANSGPKVELRAVGSPCSGLATHTEFVTSVEVATVTAVRRWQHTYTGGAWNGKSWTAPAAASSAPAVAASVGVSIGASSAAASEGSTATSSAASAASSSASSGSSTGGKKGLSYNTPSLLTQFSSAGASWAYNWGAGAGGSVPSGVEYVPMLWGRDGISAWSGAVSTAIANGASHVLSFNEPDFPSQANIAAGDAATLHIANVASLSGKVKVGSPAITNSNIAGQGLDWMTSFLAACGGSANNCKLDFLAFHWYNNPGTMDDFKSHVSSVISLATANNVPKVWLTEFAVNGDTSDQATFLAEALPYLDAQPEVERYAYFMAGNGQMLTNGALNAVGEAYVA